jgi:hypothetical protein
LPVIVCGSISGMLVTEAEAASRGRAPGPSPAGSPLPLKAAPTQSFHGCMARVGRARPDHTRRSRADRPDRQVRRLRSSPLSAARGLPAPRVGEGIPRGMRATARAPASLATPPMSAIRRQNPALCHRTTRPSPHHIGPSHRSMPSHHFNSAVTFASCLSLACSHHRNPSRRHSIVRLGWHPPSRRLPSTCPQASAARLTTRTFQPARHPA